jgi:hypothetical protein
MAEGRDEELTAHATGVSPALRAQGEFRVLDLFSGIGGLSVGLERTGKFKTVAFCEIDPYASKVLEQWWPNVPNFNRGIYALNSLLRKVPTSLRRASRARTYPSLETAPDLPAPVRDSSGHYYEPFAWFDPQARCWRTWQRCLVEGWEIFSGTWPRSGMTRSGIAFRRAPLVPLTKETASGYSLPTPTASQYGSNKSASDGSAVRPSLAQMVRLPTPRPCSGLRSSGANRTEIMRALETWPPPRATDGTHGGRVTPRKGREGGNLVEAVSARTTFATPTSRDWRSGKASPETLAKNSRPLSEQIGGALNPTWVEWLMGFPLGWTALDVLAMPSSRKSRIASAKRSSKRTAMSNPLPFPTPEAPESKEGE